MITIALCRFELNCPLNVHQKTLEPVYCMLLCLLLNVEGFLKYGAFLKFRWKRNSTQSGRYDRESGILLSAVWFLWYLASKDTECVTGVLSALALGSPNVLLGHLVLTGSSLFTRFYFWLIHKILWKLYGNWLINGVLFIVMSCDARLSRYLQWLTVEMDKWHPVHTALDCFHRVHNGEAAPHSDVRQIHISSTVLSCAIC